MLFWASRYSGVVDGALNRAPKAAPKISELARMTVQRVRGHFRWKKQLADERPLTRWEIVMVDQGRLPFFNGSPRSV